MNTPPKDDPPNDFVRQVFAGALACAGDFWGRALEIAVRYAGDALVPTPAAPSSGGDAGRPLALVRHAVTELALVPGLAAERFAQALADPAPSSAMSARTPDVDGRPVPFPARVRDAAQALALYAVSGARAQDAVGGAGAPFRVVDAGRGRTVFALFAVDYRDADLGAYHEIGAAFFVTPRTAPLGLGMLIVDLPVNQAFACAAGREIWGYPKRVETLDFAWSASEVVCALRGKDNGRPIMTVTFPRGGTGASTSVPVPGYAMLDGRPSRAVFTRTGRGERMVLDGAGVRVEVDEEAAQRGDPLAVLLRDLEIARATPILRTWTEHMSGELGPPIAIG